MKTRMSAPSSVLLAVVPTDRYAVCTAELTYAIAEGRLLCARRGVGGGRKLCPSSTSCVLVSDAEVGLYLIK